jgi:mannose-1-phosphate guanylyltransferase/mannose-6-phosphate isomerase
MTAKQAHQAPVYPVILAGGVGTRLWPLSRAALPKQLLPLVSERTLLQETALRVARLPGMMPPIIVCGNEHRFMVAEQLRDVGLAPLAILLEPSGRNTAPAVAAAALYLQSIDPQGTLLVLPADHVVMDNDAFAAAMDVAAGLAGAGALVMFGVLAQGPETGYGYIRRGQALVHGAGYVVDRFVEKPPRETAQQYVENGNYYWNSGMFMFRAARYLDELREFAPRMHGACATAVRLGTADMDFFRLEEAAFTSCDSDSIDYAVMERTAAAVVVPADIGWSDVGSWATLWQSAQSSGQSDGNVARGDGHLDALSNCMIRAESRIVAVIGVRDLVLVEKADAVLVTHRGEVQRIKQVNHLASTDRSEHVQHTKVYRSWGHYEGIDLGARFQVKRLTVKPGEKLSLQMHRHRAEHWVVVSGTARVTCGDKVSLLSENESAYIPVGQQHRLENPGKAPLHIIEVQSGSCMGEDDIVRFDDACRCAVQV